MSDEPKTLNLVAQGAAAVDQLRRRPFYYTLDKNKNVVPVPDDARGMQSALVAFEKGNSRRVALDEFEESGKTIMVSTVFLVIDHNFGGEGPPIVFETMILGSKYFEDDGYQTRCATWDEALTMHETAVAAYMAQVPKESKTRGRRARLLFDHLGNVI